jgi:hypothetical protein
LRHGGAILWGPGFEFFSQGELDPLETPAGLPAWSVKEKNGEEEFLQPEPAVRASSFRLPDGRRAFFFVNTADQGVEVECRELSKISGMQALVFRNEGPGVETSIRELVSLSLAPQEVVAVIPVTEKGKKGR